MTCEEREKVLREALQNISIGAQTQTAHSGMSWLDVNRIALAALRSGPAPQEQPPIYTVNAKRCQKCGNPFSKAEGAMIFTVCDACWVAPTEQETPKPARRTSCERHGQYCFEGSGPVADPKALCPFQEPG